MSTFPIGASGAKKIDSPRQAHLSVTLIGASVDELASPVTPGTTPAPEVG